MSGGARGPQRRRHVRSGFSLPQCPLQLDSWPCQHELKLRGGEIKYKESRGVLPVSTDWSEQTHGHSPGHRRLTGLAASAPAQGPRVRLTGILHFSLKDANFMGHEVILKMISQFLQACPQPDTLLPGASAPWRGPSGTGAR